MEEPPRKRQNIRDVVSPFDERADEIAKWFESGMSAKIWPHKRFGHVRAITSGMRSKILQLGYMDGSTFVHLIELTLYGAPVVTDVELDDFYYAHKAPPNVKQLFRAEAGPKGLTLRGYAFTWYAIGIAARINANAKKTNWEDEIQPLLKSIEIIDAWASHPTFQKKAADATTWPRVLKNVDGRYTTKVSSHILKTQEDVAKLYAQTFGGYARLSSDELADYLHQSGFYWPFTNREAYKKHGYYVGAAASFVDHTNKGCGKS